MKKLLVFLLLFTGISAFGQNTATKMIAIGYETLTFKDVNLIKTEAELLTGIEFHEVCYNHNILLFKADPEIIDIVEQMIRHLKALKTSSVPVYKEYSGRGLECDSVEPVILKEQREKQ